MPGGNANGADRLFQELCRDICVQRASGAWSPYPGTDGIDVPLPFAGSTWKLDVVLLNATGDFLVAECKRWNENVPQGKVAELALKVERLRQTTGKAVSGLLFVKTGVDPGALKHAAYEGIEVVVSEEDQPLPTFTIEMLRYDPEREKRLRAILCTMVDTCTARDQVEAVVIRADGSRV